MREIYTLSDVIFQCKEGEEIVRDDEGDIIEHRIMKSFPLFPSVKRRIPLLKNRSLKDVLDFFVSQDNSILCFGIKEDTPVYSAIGALYDINAYPELIRVAGNYSDIYSEAKDITEIVSTYEQGENLLHLFREDNERTLEIDEDRLIISFEKFLELERPIQLARDELGVMRPYLK
ncbi:hypothetical protein GOV06_02600 [Candidatus Woesearchaeota archaeon]|nr:hypothetical protein [Candidatus Woesearchaeota archaeon]